MTAQRLIFSYEGDEVTLLSQARVEMTLPPEAEHPDDIGGLLGFWVQLHDTDGNVIHRQLMHDPMPAGREVFSDDPEKGLHRAAVGQPSGAFTVVVPDHPDAAEISLVAPRGGAAVATRNAEIARFALRHPGDEPEQETPKR
jgi:hypothetical protein